MPTRRRRLSGSMADALAVKKETRPAAVTSSSRLHSRSTVDPRAPRMGPNRAATPPSGNASLNPFQGADCVTLDHHVLEGEQCVIGRHH